jgi:hypothetical protein
MNDIHGSNAADDTRDILPAQISARRVGRLSWKDIEAHRDVLSDLQWQRICEYFRDGKSLTQIHRGDNGSVDGTRRAAKKNSTELSLGRASIRLLRSMLGMPVSELSQAADDSDGAAASEREEVSPGPPAVSPASES